MHLPLRSVVMDRVTGGTVRGGISIQRKRENIYITKRSRKNRARDRVIGEREENKEEGDLVSVRRGMCRGGKVETG